MNQPLSSSCITQDRILELENEAEQLLRQNELLRNKSHWVEEEKGIWCHNCGSFFYWDENLKEMEEPFAYCPDCGSYMEYMQGKGSYIWRRR